MTHGSLFSGIGGFDLAAGWMGWHNAFHCEINPFCRQVIEYWFNTSVSYEDITKTSFERWRGQIDVLSGGFPCQPFSVAGRRRGADDDRYLWPEFKRAIREIKPGWVIGENVGGITSMVQPGKEVDMEKQSALLQEDNKEIILEQEFVIETICRDLEREGYSVQPVIIPACAIGAPHRRDRVWFIAYSNGTQCPSSGQGERTERIGSNNNGKPEKREYPSQRLDRLHEFSWDAADSASCRQFNWSSDREERQVLSDKAGYVEEDQSKWTGRECRAGANDTASSHSQCRGSRQICEKVQSEKPDGDSPDGNGYERDASYTDSKKLQERLKDGGWPYSTEIAARLDNGAKRFGDLRYPPYTHEFYGYGARLCTSEISQHVPSGIQFSRRDTEECWKDFPTKSPVCRGDDGFSGILDPAAVFKGVGHGRGAVYNRWRTEAVKAYGNAIVPQVAFEIFKAIEMTSNYFKDEKENI